MPGWKLPFGDVFPFHPSRHVASPSKNGATGCHRCLPPEIACVFDPEDLKSLPPSTNRFDCHILYMQRSDLCGLHRQRVSHFRKTWSGWVWGRNVFDVCGGYSQDLRRECYTMLATMGENYDIYVMSRANTSIRYHTVSFK